MAKNLGEVGHVSKKHKKPTTFFVGGVSKLDLESRIAYAFKL